MSIIKTERLLAYIHAPTRRCYVILTTLFAFCAQQLFFLHQQYAYETKKRKKRKIFVLFEELACTHCIFRCICMCGREKKSACILLVEKTTAIMWQNDYVKKKKSLVLVATRIGCVMWWFLSTLAHAHIVPFSIKHRVHRCRKDTNKINKYKQIDSKVLYCPRLRFSVRSFVSNSLRIDFSLFLLY